MNGYGQIKKYFDIILLLDIGHSNWRRLAWRKSIAGLLQSPEIGPLQNEETRFLLFGTSRHYS